VARHPVGKEWAFYEIKRPGDRAQKGQLEGLLFLRILTGGVAAVVQVMPTTQDCRSTEPLPVAFDYRGDIVADVRSITRKGVVHL
jgi:hypothetical protein